MIPLKGLPLPVLHSRAVAGPRLDPLRLHGLHPRLRPPRHARQGGVQQIQSRPVIRVMPSFVRYMYF